MLTLWDLIDRLKRPRRKPPASGPASAPPESAAPEPGAGAAARPDRAAAAQRRRSASGAESMRERYLRAERECLREYGIRVRKWRKSMTGCAWEVHFHNGGVSRLIEAPRPRGPMSAAIFLHEVGHHAIGFGRWRPRCLEELKAWQWALAEMERRRLNVTDSVRKRVNDSMQYAVWKARKRGIKRLPAELTPYVRHDWS